MEAIDRIESAVNQRQAWLSIEPTRQAGGDLSLVVNINGHFHATAADDSPAAIARALAGLFGGMHGAVVTAAGKVSITPLVNIRTPDS